MVRFARRRTAAALTRGGGVELTATAWTLDGIEPAADGAAGTWLAGDLLPWHGGPVLTGCLVPNCYPAYAALRHPPSDGQRPIGAPPASLAAVLVTHLEPATSTPDRCWMAVWHGWGGLDGVLDDIPTLELPGRRYALFHGAVRAVAAGVLRRPSGGDALLPSLWWPEDRSWCVASDVDGVVTLVGGLDECITTVLASAELEAQRSAADLPAWRESDAAG
jgi:hypothetical protein